MHCCVSDTGVGVIDLCNEEFYEPEDGRWLVLDEFAESLSGVKPDVVGSGCQNFVEYDTVMPTTDEYSALVQKR